MPRGRSMSPSIASRTRASSSTEGAVSAARGQRPEAVVHGHATWPEGGQTLACPSCRVCSAAWKVCWGRRDERLDLAPHGTDPGVPRARRAAAGVLGDLAEDYAGQRTAHGALARGHSGSFAKRALSREPTRPPAKPLSGSRARSLSRDEFVHAWRALRGRPGTPALCALLLALGIGLVTAMFSVVDSMMLRPVPFADADRLVRQGFGALRTGGHGAWESSGLSSRSKRSAKPPLGWTPHRAFNWLVRSSHLAFLECSARAQLRAGASSDLPPQGTAGDEVIISEGIWRSVYGGDRTLLGRQIRSDGQSLTVVGIMPADFRFPTPATVAVAAAGFAPAPRVVTIYGRLGPVCRGKRSTAPLAAIAAQHARLPPNTAGTPPVYAVANTSITTPTGRRSRCSTGGVVLVFLALAANVVILLLSRLSQRHHELATCAALGASRSRLLRQIALEHIFIGVIGIALGVAVAWAITTAFPSYFLLAPSTSWMSTGGPWPWLRSAAVSQP